MVGGSGVQSPQQFLASSSGATNSPTASSVVLPARMRFVVLVAGLKLRRVHLLMEGYSYYGKVSSFLFFLFFSFFFFFLSFFLILFSFFFFFFFFLSFLSPSLHRLSGARLVVPWGSKINS